MNPVRLVAVALFVLVGGAFVALWMDHRSVLLALVAATLEIPDLAEPGDEGPEVTWFDDYFTVHPIDEATWAIGETRYHQRNFNYLIVGRDRAVLLDTGPGLRDIGPVVRSLTDRPVVVVASHLHYDHVGNHARFERGAMIDLPHLRARTRDGRLTLTQDQHLGRLEGLEAPALPVTEWWTHEQQVELGGRRLRVLHTPGHTPESLVLFDPDRDRFYTGDTLYPGELFAFLPGSSLGDYTRSVLLLLEHGSEVARYYGAHRVADRGLPVLERADLVALRDTLGAIRRGEREGEDVFPRRFLVNERLTLLTDVAWGRSFE